MTPHKYMFATNILQRCGMFSDRGRINLFVWLYFPILKPSVGDKFEPSLLASDRGHYNYHILQAQQKCEIQLNPP